MQSAKIAIIGGSGVYSIEDRQNPSDFASSQNSTNSADLKNVEEVSVETPFGPPSDKIILGEFSGKKIAFLSRHGRGHVFPPHLVNYRANIYALKKLGVERIFAVNACGSLREDFTPGEIVIVDQFIDRTKSRASTFFDGKNKSEEFSGVCHISVAEPFCAGLRKKLISAAEKLNIPHKKSGTYICIEGPRFSTRAESKMFQKMGADIIGMTMFPEIVLAREMGICYASVALNTDYDCWDESRPPVSNQEVLRTMKENVSKAKKLIFSVIPELPEERVCNCSRARENAMM